ncbi:uncharacterized protein LOC134723290 isoform X1 [Mytilus trossulus]|uniref:uncharacterized protein LOC134723290 isoform X1 n=1 Tax=Mytilus trossulus TaxID=6551 RepID=UPI0030058289
MAAEDTKENMTIEGVDVGKVRNFPFSALKTLGSIQIGIGGICIGLGIIDFLLFIFFEDKFVPDPKMKESEAYQKVDTLTKTFSPVWCGVWFCVTGAFAAILSQKKLANINYYKMTFLILSITCAAVSGPLCLIVSVTSAYLRHQITPEGFRWLVPLLVMFFAFCEIIFALISASVCCCCAPFDSSRVRVLLAKQQDDNFHAIVQKEKSIDSFDIFTTSDRRGKPLPPRNQEIKQEAKEPTVQKVDRVQQTTAKEDKRPPPAQKEERKQEKPQTEHRTRESKRSHDRKPERKDSLSSENYKHKDDEEFDGSRFEEDNPVRTRGYADRPYTKGSSYEQLKSLVIPKTAPKQTF